MCGIVGAISKNNKNIIPETINLLLKLQHRGQDSAGICFVEDNKLKLIKNNGLIKNVLDDINSFSNLAIAHTRYKTSGDDSTNCAQPFIYNDFALVHNGTVDVIKQRKILLEKGVNFESNADSEVILKWLLYKSKNHSLEEFFNILKEDFSECAYCIILLTKDKIMVFKDKNSYRPLTFFETKEGYYLTSEEVNFDSINKFELPPLSALEITKGGYRTLKDEVKKLNRCVFEAVYFASPKHKVFNLDVKNIRIELGELLAKFDSTEADYVVPVMNSGFYGAVGYSKKKNIPLKTLIKNKQKLRTFIEKSSMRNLLVNEKYSISSKVKDKRIILVDDSIVRGTTSKHLVKLLKEKGAKEIHLRLTSPMIINSCYWGVDIPDKRELLAYNFKSIDNIKEELGVDSIKFIPNLEFKKLFNTDKWCHKCFIATKIQE